MAKLLVVEGPDWGLYFEFVKNEYTLGSAAGNDIVLSDSGVAPRQLSLNFDGEIYAVRNLAPDAPLQINGAEAAEAHLTHGDVLAVGESLLYFEQDPALDQDLGPEDAEESPEITDEPGPHAPELALELSASDPAIPAQEDFLAEAEAAAAPARECEVDALSQAAAEAEAEAAASMLGTLAAPLSPPNGIATPKPPAARGSSQRPGALGTPLLDPKDPRLASRLAPARHRRTNSSIVIGPTSADIRLLDDSEPSVNDRQQPYEHTGEIVRHWYDRGGKEDLDRRLSTLYQIAATLGQHFETRPLLESVLEILMREVTADRAMVLLWDSAKKELVQGATRHRFPTTSRHAEQVSRAVLSEALAQCQSLLITDASTDNRFSERHSVVGLKLRSVLVAPLMAEKQLVGFLYLDSHSRAGVFKREDLEMATAVALLVSNALERLRLLDVRREKERMEAEVRSARIVQDILLPRTVPQLPGYVFAVKGSIQGDLGGDYYDFIPMAGGRLALVMGDVSGHDIASALVMSMARAVLRSQCLRELDPARILQATNDVVHGDTPKGMFLTLFLGVLEPEAGQLHYANAGHPYPFLIHEDGSADRFREGGIPIGLYPKASYNSGKAQLRRNDLLVLYTDGLLEVADPQGEFFGEERLRETLTDRSRAAPDRLVETVMHKVHQHTKTQHLGDDVAIMAVRVERDPPTEERPRTQLEISVPRKNLTITPGKSPQAG